MGYEQDEPYVVDDEGGDYVSQHATLEEAEKALKEYFLEQDVSDDHTIGSGDGACISLMLSTAEYDLSTSELYTLHQTAEWSSIQQALKELDEIKSGDTDYGMVRDKYDELAAELERVKAGTIKELEWSELHENHFVAETFGDTEIEIWLEEALNEPEWHWGWVTPKTEDDFPNAASSLEEAKTLAAKWHYEHIVEWLMPTAESCRAAHEGKEGENDAN